MLTNTQKKKCVVYYNNLVLNYLKTGNIVYLKKIRLMLNNVKLKKEIAINSIFVVRWGQYIPTFKAFNDDNNYIGYTYICLVEGYLM